MGAEDCDAGRKRSKEKKRNSLVVPLCRSAASQSHSHGPVGWFNGGRNSAAGLSLAGLQSDLFRGGCVLGPARRTATPQGEVPGA